MDTPEGNSRRSRSGPQRGSGPRGTAGGTRATVLGSLTLPGRPEQVATARAFVARTLSSHQVGADYDAATLLTSETVTNAIQHTKSGVDGGTVTIVVIGSSILELGCGAGRVTHPLVALGHPVVAVDESPEMLAHVRGAETVRARIQDLRLGRPFDAVLLASFLVNVADHGLRRRTLEVCREHV